VVGWVCEVLKSGEIADSVKRMDDRSQRVSRNLEDGRLAVWLEREEEEEEGRAGCAAHISVWGD
jgi:hypothetical protein